MNWIAYLVPALILLPLAGGVLAAVLPGYRLRNSMVNLIALLIAAGGIVFGKKNCKDLGIRIGNEGLALSEKLILNVGIVFDYTVMYQL